MSHENQREHRQGSENQQGGDHADQCTKHKKGEQSRRPDLYAEGNPTEEAVDSEADDSERSISIETLDFNVVGGKPKLTVKGIEMSGFFKETANPISAILTELRDNDGGNE